MKLVYLSESVIPSRWANSVHVVKMCAALSDCGHSVRLVALLGRQGIGSVSALLKVGQFRSSKSRPLVFSYCVLFSESPWVLFLGVSVSSGR